VQPKSDHWGRLLRFGLQWALLVLPAGCATIGAGSVNRDRLDYAEALASSWKEQMLLNIVKLRYADTPVFLEVSSVISSYQLQTQANLSGTVSSGLTAALPDTVGRGVTLGASGSYTDKPTITYTPLQGDKFTRELLRPLAPAVLFQLVQAGYPVDLIFQLATRAINGIYNRSGRPMAAREADPEFYLVLDALRRLQVSEVIGLRLEKRGPEETSLITFRSDKIPPAVQEDGRLLRTLLGLNPEARELTLTFGAVPRNDREVALLTRSMIEILLELAARVEVPAADLAEGSALPGAPAPRPDRGPRDLPLVIIHANEELPANAFVAVRYHRHWFWIDHRDFRSKSIFTFLLLLTSLAQSGVPPQAPVITVPAS
jgi:hypothetical protein